MQIETVDLEIQREPFARPFGFKGAAFHEKWNAVVRLRDGGGREAFGLGGLATLWADAEVFSAHTETGGNLLALAVLEFALQRVKGRDFADPSAMLDAVLPEAHEYAAAITRRPGLRRTFTLVSLVALDNAAWMLHARQRGIADFPGLVPPNCAAGLPARHSRLAAVPLVPYGLPDESLRRLLDEGAFFLKIKIGQAGGEEEMLRKDMERIAQVHRVADGHETPMTNSGRVLYYLDANGRYGRKETLLRLLDHAEKLGMADRVALVEEPFPEEFDEDVSDIPACLAADESVHSIADLETRVKAGYGAAAIKPAGKTLSMGFRMAEACARLKAPCFVADNACVPILVDWNKNVAARLPALPGMQCGCLESNGPTTYATWGAMLAQHPYAGAKWLRPDGGAFSLDSDFYKESGGIFRHPAPYADLFRK